MSIATAEGVDKAKLSPMMRHYLETKEKNPDCILFYRLGDFYEMFFDDAVTVSRLLELTLTGKDCGLDDRAAMCGIPFHASESYIKKLIELGKKVAVCEQTEDPALAKGLVEREIVRIVTPGTVLSNEMLEDGENNFLASVFYDKENQKAGLCFADISTGKVAVEMAEGKNVQDILINILTRYNPAEMLVNEDFCRLDTVMNYIKIQTKALISMQENEFFSIENSGKSVLGQFQAKSFAELGLSEDGVICNAVCCLFAYIEETQRGIVGRFTDIDFGSGDIYMTLDYRTIRNLELCETMRNKEKKGSLFGILDKTKTFMGRRLLKNRIEQPLISPARIISRLSAVEELVNSGLVLMEIRDYLDKIYDLERLMTRVMYKTATPRDMKSLCITAQQLPGLKAKLSDLKDSRLLKQLNDNISELREIYDLLEVAIVDEPPVNYKDGGVIKEGFDKNLDELRNIMNGGEEIIKNIEASEREKTGIKNLKVGYNRVFGYYIEVTRSYYSLVPDNYTRKQTLANSERFITSELKETENKVLGAKEKALALEEKIFTELREFLAVRIKTVQKTAEAVAEIDVLCSFAECSIQNNYVKPEITADGSIKIKNGRHPVVESMLSDELFVPNDTQIDTSARKLAVITGPNMSGKSTYMRQVALITLMAQIGCFVPAEYARISVCDRIFTRIGASDDLASGQSTFMVEMQEVSDILRFATKESLVILDEVGRGTSTSDGVSIAQAVAEYISQTKKLGCKTLFATHYHELIQLENKLPGVINLSVAVKKSGDTVKFLRKIVSGGADESYGIEVAKLAGLPKAVLDKAKEKLQEYEADRINSKTKSSDDQLSFFELEKEQNISILKRTNIDELTDSECRELLQTIQSSFREEN